jgi:hypothetical protein
VEATAIIGINYRALLGLPPNFARWHLAKHKFDPELGFVYEPYARFSSAKPLSSGAFRTAEGRKIPMYFFMYTRLRNDSWCSWTRSRRS